MNKGSKLYEQIEGSIFDEMTLYKVVKTTKGQTVMLHLDGSASTIVPIMPINTNSYDEEDYEEMFEKIQKVIEKADEDEISIQFVMLREKAKINKKDFERLPTYLQPRATYLETLAEENKLFQNFFYLSIHCKNKNEQAKKDGIIKVTIDKFKNRNNILHRINQNMLNIDRRVSKVIETTMSFCQMLKDEKINSGFKILTEPQEFIDILQKFTRPNKSKNSKLIIDRQSEMDGSVRQQLFAGVRADVRKLDFTLDDYYHRVYTMDRAPKKMIVGTSIRVMDKLPYELIYSMTFRKMQNDETKKAFMWRLAEARMVAGKNEDALVEDLTLEANKDRLQQAWHDFSYGNGCGVEASANVVLRVSEAHMDKKCRETKQTRDEIIRSIDMEIKTKVFESFGDSEWTSEPNLGWKVFNKIIPGMSTIHTLILKKIILVSQDIPYFFSIYDNIMPGVHHNGTNHFIDMKDTVIPFDLMNPKLPAWNYAISGQTGSGKSVLMNAILTMQLAETSGNKSPVICILDVGGDFGSYSKFMELAHGVEINLSSAIRPTIQLFGLKPELSLPTNKKRKELAQYLKKQYDKIEMDDKELENRIVNYFKLMIKAGSEKMAEKDAHAELFEKATALKWKKDINPLLLAELKKLEQFDAEMEKRIQMIGSIDDEFVPEQLKNQFNNKSKESKVVFEEYKEIFVLKVGECKPDEQKTKLIMSILGAILSSTVESMDAWSAYDQDTIGGFVNELYEKIGDEEKRLPTMTDFYNFLKDSNNVDQSMPESRKLIKKIQNWTMDGQYPMFDQETNINMDHDIILADMKGVESEPKLQFIYTMLISELFSNKMYFIKDRRKLIVRDEAWSLMKNKQAREFFVEDLRTARKNGFATIALSQRPTDYLSPDPDAGKAILSNMQVQIFCKFDKTTIPDVVNYFKLQESVANELKTLGLVKTTLANGSTVASYSKFMMMVGDEVYYLKNELHPFEYILYSSSMEDNAVIRYFRTITKQIPDLEECLAYIASGKHIGDEKLAKFLENSGFSNKARSIVARK